MVVMFGICSGFLTQGFEAPWDPMSDRGALCSNEVTQGGLLDGLWSPKRLGHDEEPGTFSAREEQRRS